MNKKLLIADSEDEDNEIEFSEGSVQMIRTTDCVHGCVLNFKHTSVVSL